MVLAVILPPQVLPSRRCQQAHRGEGETGLIHTGSAEVVKKWDEGMKLSELLKILWDVAQLKPDQMILGVY